MNIHDESGLAVGCVSAGAPELEEHMAAANLRAVLPHRPAHPLECENTRAQLTPIDFAAEQMADAIAKAEYGKDAQPEAERPLVETYDRSFVTPLLAELKKQETVTSAAGDVDFNRLQELFENRTHDIEMRSVYADDPIDVDDYNNSIQMTEDEIVEIIQSYATTAEADLAKAREVIAELVKGLNHMRRQNGIGVPEGGTILISHALNKEITDAALRCARAFMDGK